jgi:cell division protein FtsA
VQHCLVGSEMCIRDRLYELVAHELKRSGMEDMIASGIVITGGSSLMKGMVNLGESVFRMPVRIGTPRNVGGLSEVVDNPRYSTGIGLLLMGKGQLEKEMMDQIDGNSINQIFMKMKNWFQGNF